MVRRSYTKRSNTRTSQTISREGGTRMNIHELDEVLGILKQHRIIDHTLNEWIRHLAVTQLEVTNEEVDA